MSKELVTKEDSDKLLADLQEAEDMFKNIREHVNSIDSFVARKLLQAVLLPMAAVMDYARHQVRKQVSKK